MGISLLNPRWFLVAYCVWMFIDMRGGLGNSPCIVDVIEVVVSFVSSGDATSQEACLVDD